MLDSTLLLIIIFFDIISFVELSETLLAPIFFSESVFVLHMKQRLEVYSVYKYLTSSSICKSHRSLLMHDLHWQNRLTFFIKLINLVSLLIGFQKESFFILSTMNFEVLAHVLESMFLTIIIVFESLVKFGEIFMVSFFFSKSDFLLRCFLYYNFV